MGNYLEQFGHQNKPTNFTIDITDYDPETGLVIAKGNDMYGKSGIVGLIRQMGPPKQRTDLAWVKLHKTYPSSNRGMPHSFDVCLSPAIIGTMDGCRDFGMCEYVGTLEYDRKHGVIADGQYHTAGGNHLLTGVWKMEAKVQKKPAPHLHRLGV